MESVLVFASCRRRRPLASERRTRSSAASTRGQQFFHICIDLASEGTCIISHGTDWSPTWNSVRNVQYTCLYIFHSKLIKGGAHLGDRETKGCEGVRPWEGGAVPLYSVEMQSESLRRRRCPPRNF